MRVVRNHQRLKRNAGGREAPDEIGALAEPHVAIVITVNQQNR